MRYFCLIIFISLDFVCLEQTIPIVIMYLGKLLLNEIPKKFNLSVSPTFAAVERIAISNDGKCILYHENNGYNPSSMSRDKYYKYENKKWSGPYILIDNAEAPALSITGDTVFFGHQGFVWYSVRNNSNWTQTLKFSNIPYWHYLKITNSGTYYAAMKNAKGKIGKTDWSKITITKTDTLITSLGAPLNTTNDNLDFYISKDESFIIFASDRADIVKYGYFDLFVSFRKNDN